MQWPPLFVLRRWRAHVAAGEAARAAEQRTREAAVRWKRRYEQAGLALQRLRDRSEALQRRAEELRDRWARERTARAEAEARVVALGLKLEAKERSLGHARRQNGRLRAAVLSWDVVRQSLPLRLAAARARAARPEALERDRCFLTASLAYARVLAGDAAPADGASIARTSVQSLVWNVPVMREGDERRDSQWMRKQKFPYRAIVQTRELAMGGVMLDLGANTGRMSIPRAILGDVSAIYCAEPDPVNYLCLVRNVVDNGLRGLVMPDNLAVGDVDGVATLQRSRHSGGHRLVVEAGSASPGSTVTVPTRTLDTWLAELGVEPDLVTFVKMDVQGWEAHVLEGAAGLLARRHVAWQAEVSPALLRRAGTDLPTLFGTLRRHFTCFTDLNKDRSATRSRSTSELERALGYLGESPHAQTDLLLFNL